MSYKRNKITYKNVKNKYKKNKNKKGGTLKILASEKLLDLGVTPQQLEEMGYPDEIVSTVKKVNTARNTVKNRIKTKKKVKELLKQWFEAYDLYSAEQRFNEQLISQFDEENGYFNPCGGGIEREGGILAYLTKMAGKILNKKDYQTEFWKEMMGKIYVSLINYQHLTLDPRYNFIKCSNGPENYRKVEKNFVKYILPNYVDPGHEFYEDLVIYGDFYEIILDYLEDEEIRKKLIKNYRWEQR